jgi:hypothetical protein
MLSFFCFEQTFVFFFKRSFFQKLTTQQHFGVFLSTAPARFLPQMRGKHLLNGEKMAFERTTETILRRQISDLSGQFSDHSG